MKLATVSVFAAAREALHALAPATAADFALTGNNTPGVATTTLAATSTMPSPTLLNESKFPYKIFEMLEHAQVENFEHVGKFCGWCVAVVLRCKFCLRDDDSFSYYALRRFP